MVDALGDKPEMWKPEAPAASAPPPASARIVREFPLQIPAGVQFFVCLGLVDQPAGRDQFEAAAERLALFRIEPMGRPSEASRLRL